MGDYDKILKENIAQIFLPLLEKFTGIKIAKSEELKDKVQRTLEREPDFLRKVEDHNGSRYIIQLEFQSSDDSNMVYRMAEYKALLQRKYQIPVKQFVIYLGQKKPKMRTELQRDEQIIGFSLHNVHEIEPQTLTQSNIPEELILTILSNFKSQIHKR